MPPPNVIAWVYYGQGGAVGVSGLGGERRADVYTCSSFHQFLKDRSFYHDKHSNRWEKPNCGYVQKIVSLENGVQGKGLSGIHLALELKRPENRPQIDRIGTVKPP